MLLEKLRDIAKEVGLDPDVALQMTVVDFMRAVSMRRALREARTIVFARIALQQRTVAS